MKVKQVLERDLFKSMAITTIIFGILAVCVLLQSCAKEELDFSKLNQFGEPKNVTVSASLPQASNTSKTTIDFNDNGKVLWETTDSISVNGTTLSKITVSSADKRNATFSGEVSPLSTTHYWGVYPTSIATDKNVSGNYTTSAVKGNLPTTQTYQHDTIPSFMVAYCSTSDNEVPLSFKNLCSIIKIPVQAASGVTGTSAQLKKIEVYSSENISGTATVSWNNGGDPTITISGSTKITLDCGNEALSQGTATNFYVMVPAGTQTLIINFYDNNSKFMQKNLTSCVLTRSRIHTTNVVSLNATTWTWESGDFSVNDSTTVKFSPGSLQYIGSAATPYWKFADHQWEYLGSANAYDSTNTNIDRDLFGWGCTGYRDTRSSYQKYYQPYSTNNSNAYTSGTGYTQNRYGYGPDYVSSPYYSLTVANKSDWGYLSITNPNTGTVDASGTWRTLTNAEWGYLLSTRNNNADFSSNNYLSGVGTLTLADGSTTVLGLFILPDNYYTENPSVTHTSQTGWTMTQADLEASGVVFLPASGGRDGSSVFNAGSYGGYWSSTPYGSSSAYGLLFGSSYVGPQYGSYRYYGNAVRLVKDAN